MAEPVPVAAPVERVDLFEDRAAVTRLIALPAGPGRHHLAIEGVSPLVTERHVTFPSTAGLLVEEVLVERERVPRTEADPERAKRLLAERDALRDKRRAAEDAARRADERVAFVAASLTAAVAWTPRLLVAEDGPPIDALREIASERTGGRLDARERWLEVEKLTQELARVERDLADARSGTLVWRSRLLVRILVRDPTTAMLRVRYTLPCALWRPVHRATLTGGRLAWEVGAMAWNATGEDWVGVTLVCSTSRPGNHATPPTLVDNLIFTRRREKEVVVEAREEVVQVAREGEARRTREVPGVDDGGEPRTFTAPRPVDLPSNGRPVSVRLEAWESDATTTWLAHPERSSQFVLRSRQVNAGTRPLLAGPVELFRDSGAVGRGRVGFVPPGEPFALGWGSHDAVRVSRKSDGKVEQSRLTGWQTWKFTVSLKVANLGHERTVVEVKERLPVSEIADVKVHQAVPVPSLDHGPDADGMCTWRLELEAGAVRTITLAYTLEAPASVRLPF